MSLPDTRNETGPVVGVYVRDWPAEHLDEEAIVGLTTIIVDRPGERRAVAIVKAIYPDPDEPGTRYIALDVMHGMEDTVRRLFDDGEQRRHASIMYKPGTRNVIYEVAPWALPPIAPLMPSTVIDPRGGVLTGIYAAVANERMRAHAKHGATSMEARPVDDLYRYTILVEEVGEVGKVFNEAMSKGGLQHLDLNDLHNECLQVAAMATAWAETAKRALDDQ